jgi:PEP-CTERM motif
MVPHHTVVPVAGRRNVYAHPPRTWTVSRIAMTFRLIRGSPSASPTYRNAVSTVGGSFGADCPTADRLPGTSELKRRVSVSRSRDAAGWRRRGARRVAGSFRNCATQFTYQTTPRNSERCEDRLVSKLLGIRGYVDRHSRPGWPSVRAREGDETMQGLEELVRYNLATVPDPGTLVLIGSGVAGLGALWRRFVRRRAVSQDADSRDTTPTSVPDPSRSEDT